MLAAAHTDALVVFGSWLAILVLILVRFRARPGRPAGAVAGAWPLVAIAAVVLGDVWLLAGSALPAWWRTRRAAARRRRRSARGRRAVRLERALSRASTAASAAPIRRFITAADPLGIDRSDPAGRDDFVLINLLVLPEGRPAVVHLAAKDVIHSFTLAEMRVKQDVTPGLPTTTWFTPTASGHVGDRLLAVVRPGPLPHARRLRGAHRGGVASVRGRGSGAHRSDAMTL